MTLKCYRVDRSVLRRIFGHEQMDGSEVFLRDEKSLVVSILSSDYFIFGILGRCTPRTTKRSWWRWWRKWRKWTWKIMKNDHDGDDEPPCPENSLWELWGDACSWGNRLIDCISFDFTVVVAKQSFWFLFRKMFAHCYFGRAGRPVLAIIFWYFSTRWCVKADKVASAATSSGWRITRTYNANCPVVAATYPSSWPLLHLLVRRKRVPHALRQFHKCSFHFSLIKAIFAPALYWCVLVRSRDQVQQRNQQCGLGGGGGEMGTYEPYLWRLRLGTGCFGNGWLPCFLCSPLISGLFSWTCWSEKRWLVMKVTTMIIEGDLLLIFSVQPFDFYWYILYSLYYTS